jgi:hypothetical protein
MNIKLFEKYLQGQDFERKINTRIDRLQRAEMNPIDKTSVLIDIQDDPILFIDLFGLVYEPRLPEVKDIPFFLFPYQIEAIYKIMESENRGEDLLIEKSRDMGMTWVMVWYFLWRWLTKERWSGLMGSRKEELVDDSTPNSLFGKLRYGLYSMPNWARPNKFRKSENDNHLKLMNPDKMSFITGESSNQNFGRGGRSSVIFFDEAFSWKYGRESWRSCTDTTQCRIAVSSAMPTSFARNLRDSMDSQGRLLSLNWDKHPFKDEQWFKDEEKRRSSDPLAMQTEINMSYLADPEFAYYPEVLMCPVRKLEYNNAIPLYIGLDFGARDKTAIVYMQRDSTNYYCIDGFEKSQKPLYWYYPFIKKGYSFIDKDEYELENKFTKEKFVLRKKDYLTPELNLIERFNAWNYPVMLCGEVAHKQKMIKSNTSIQQELAGIGIMLRINDSGFEHKVRRNATKKMLSKTIFADTDGALIVLDSLANSSFSKRMGSTSDTTQDKPVHDEWADLRSAVENLAVNVIANDAKIREIPYKKIHTY